MIAYVGDLDGEQIIDDSGGTITDPNIVAAFHSPLAMPKWLAYSLYAMGAYFLWQAVNHSPKRRNRR